MWPPRTVAITDHRRLDGRGTDGEDAALVAFVAAMATSGVDAIQVRERDWSDGRLLRVTRAALDAVQGSACRVLVNEHAHVAVAAGAHGVHLRGTGMPVGRVRLAWPAGLLIGRSVHAGDDDADAADADMVMFGMVFPSASKAPDAPVAGLPALANWAQRPDMAPVVAIGGIDVDRCAAVHASGACGIAGIDLFVRALQQGPSALAAVVREVHAVFQDRERAE
jgi:thiamine-phosphate pyrophosphorylase